MKKVVFVFVLIFAISFVSASIPDDCLSSIVSFWEFDNDLTDSIASNDGAATGSITYSAGKVGKAANFQSGDSILISDASNLKPSEGLSIEFWFKKTAFPLPHTWDVVNKQGYQITVDEDSIDVSIGTETLTAPISASTNYFVVITWDGSDAKLYINEIQVGSDVPLSSITYGTDDLIIGGNDFNGFIDELAIYNVALSQTEINDHYFNSNQGVDYCYSSSDDSSDTRRDFSLAGCDDVPGMDGNFILAVNTCLRQGTYAGEYYCSPFRVLLDTLQDKDVCDNSEPSCCPTGFICEERTDEGEYCYQRDQECGDYEDEDDCIADSCIWESGECYDPNDPSLSCSIYEAEIPCKEDVWKLGQTGAGTSLCGTITSEGMVIPRESCHCEWINGDSECVLSYSSVYGFYDNDGNDGLFNCLKSFDSGACIDGEQEVNWTIAYFSGSPTPSELIASNCVDGEEIRVCGQPIVSLPFFGFVNFIVVGLLLGLFYLVFKKSL